MLWSFSTSFHLIAQLLPQVDLNRVFASAKFINANLNVYYGQSHKYIGQNEVEKESQAFLNIHQTLVSTEALVNC